MKRRGGLQRSGLGLMEGLWWFARSRVQASGFSGLFRARIQGLGLKVKVEGVGFRA